MFFCSPFCSVALTEPDLNFPDQSTPELAHLILSFRMCTTSCVLVVTEICPSYGRSRRMGEGVAAGVGVACVENARERDTLGQRGASSSARLTSLDCPMASGRCQVFTITGPAEKLKN